MGAERDEDRDYIVGPDGAVFRVDEFEVGRNMLLAFLEGFGKACNDCFDAREEDLSRAELEALIDRGTEKLEHYPKLLASLPARFLAETRRDNDEEVESLRDNVERLKQRLADV